MKAQHQRPEGRLIEQAMKTWPTVSGRELAKRVGLSEGRIRQIVNGYKKEAGVVLDVIGPADTVARIAAEVGIEASEMDAAGRPDVAEMLRDKPSVGVTEEGDLWLSDRSLELEALREWLDQDDPSGSPPVVALSLWEVEELLEAARVKHRDEVLLLNHVIRVASSSRRKGGDGDADDSRGSAPTKEPLSAVADTSSGAIAADEQETSIAGEQESTNET